MHLTALRTAGPATAGPLLAADTPGSYAADGPDGTADPLDRLMAAAHGYDELLRDVLDATLDLQAGDGSEQLTGLTVAEHLELSGALPRWLARQVDTVGRRLGSVPQVASCYHRRVLRFDELAGFLRAVTRLHGSRLVDIDEAAARLARELAATGRTHEWLAEVEQLLQDQQAPGMG